MVLAGAGSGKTRVVTRRIARLLRDGVRPGQILAMTFTNKAAGEMAHRVAELGGGYVRVATFHSACARFLRQDGHHLGYPPDFSIYDTQDRDTLIKELLEDLGIGSAQAKPSLVGQWISKLKNAALKPADMGGGRTTSAASSNGSGRRTTNACARSARWTSTTCSACSCRSCASTRRSPSATSSASVAAGRRVPGHQPRPVRPAEAAVPAAGQPVRRRRPGPVDLRLPRRRGAQHPRVRTRLPDHDGGAARDRTTAARPTSCAPPRR
jgi:hypothetical protein